MKSKKSLFIGGSIVAILLISVGSGYLYGNYKQNLEYEKWLKESQEYAQLPAEQEEYIKNEKIPREPNGKLKAKEEIDQLKIGETRKIVRKPAAKNQNFISKTEKSEKKDLSSMFIEKYYQSISEKDLETAYAMSKKSVNFATFQSWYLHTDKITIDKLIRIDDITSSLELTLYEGDLYTRYGVLITLKLKNLTPMQIADSQVRILSSGKLIEKGEKIIIEKEEIAQTHNFYEVNKNKAISISNEKFNEILNGNQNNYIILDAREDIEFENGYLQGSKHIRYADLQAGKWIEIPEDKFVYVICWSGIRGKEVAEFLRSKNIAASYLENGANGWVNWGGKWIGSIKFSEKYSANNFKKIFSTDELKNEVAKGVTLVDSREPWKFKNWHLAGSYNIAMMYVPTKDLAKTFDQIPKNSIIITICDDYVNCFDAKITGAELEKRGHQFLGRYNKPWEYD